MKNLAGRRPLWKRSRRLRDLLRLLVIGVAAFSVVAAQESLYVTTKSAERSEIELRKRVEQVVLKYELQRWLYSRRIVIDRAVWPPHSHPVLTLGVTERFLHDDVELVAVLVHEEFHWNLALNSGLSKWKLMALLKAFLPVLRVAPPFGSEDDVSTYMHVLVCYMEYKALSKVFGQPAAQSYLSKQPFYTDVYATVLDEANSPKIEMVLARAGLTY